MISDFENLMPQTPASKTAADAEAPANRRVLVIEDDIASMELMVHLLSSYGYAPLRARNGEEGLKIAARERPALILSEVHMPFVDGYEIAQRIRADPALNRIPLIAVTDFALPEHRKKALAAGFDGYVTKPISPEHFVQHLQVFLRPDFRTASASVRLPEAAAGPSPRVGRKVLLVDDNPSNLKLSSILLGSSGYQVVTAQNMSEALRVVRDNPPDLIMSDVVMSGGSGYEFIRAVKADPRSNSIPFIFLTASMNDEPSRGRGLALGAARFLFRPIESKDLLREVEACLEQQPHPWPTTGK